MLLLLTCTVRPADADGKIKGRAERDGEERLRGVTELREVQMEGSSLEKRSYANDSQARVISEPVWRLQSLRVVI